MSDTVDTEETDVGLRLRQIRVGRRLTLKHVAGVAGITEGFLSQIETGRSAPSLKTFRKISAALGMDPSDVLDSHDFPLPRKVPASGGRTLSIGDVSKFRVTPPGMTSLEIIRGELAVGGSTGEGYTHGDSDEAIIVLTGEITATVNDADFHIASGETLCFRSSMPHSIRNVGAEVATILWVISPPTSTIAAAH